MTANKDFKRLVRERMRRSGLSYAAARHLLRRQEQEPKLVLTREEMHQMMAAMRQAIRDALTPIANARGEPLDADLVSTVIFDREVVEDDAQHWVVHLYSLSPGRVIGEEGRTAATLREELCRISGDDRLRLNIVDFAKVHANRQRLTE